MKLRTKSQLLFLLINPDIYWLILLDTIRQKKDSQLNVDE